MERSHRDKRFKRFQEYGEQCSRCATRLPTGAGVCTGCGMSLTIPVQLPSPREASAA